MEPKMFCARAEAAKSKAPAKNTASILAAAVESDLKVLRLLASISLRLDAWPLIQAQHLTSFLCVNVIHPP
jgi:hypothetical protein